MHRVAVSPQSCAQGTKRARNYNQKTPISMLPMARASGGLAAACVMLLTAPSDVRATEFLTTATISEDQTCVAFRQSGHGEIVAALPGSSERFTAPQALACPIIESTSSPANSLQTNKNIEGQPALNVEEDNGGTATAAIGTGTGPSSSATMAHHCDIARLRGPLPYTANISSRLSYTICGMRSSSGPSLPGRNA
ncbi:hypothetical protein Vretimale_8118 [Volvox reticuliferus]|uniref:Uncharacterized protein n=1 Tax=Volvox reticuliferus TaxID=1737510 RepID=A0A8J4GAQ3_9CHLO|nr:hypothetical protein Vretifemale_5267 [Volvox reticuliferus]GIM03363.1 hypothetical protein Vretimale_8118 [Volvox reticuliferus]